MKLAKEAGITSNSSVGGGGVGKYLNLKRPREASVQSAVAKVDDKDGKKRKIGFGEFEGW